MSIWRDWVTKADKELASGEKIWISVENKNHQRVVIMRLRQEVDILSRVDPIAGNSLIVVPAVKDNRMWVCIERSSINPLVGIKQLADGTFERLSLSNESERKRMIRLMLKDGIPLSKIKEDLTLSVKEVDWAHDLLHDIGEVSDE